MYLIFKHHSEQTYNLMPVMCVYIFFWIKSVSYGETKRKNDQTPKLIILFQLLYNSIKQFLLSVFQT